MSKRKQLYKTTIVIWSDYDPSNVELDNLAREAQYGAAFCSKQHTIQVTNVERDPDWVYTEFFDSQDHLYPLKA